MQPNHFVLRRDGEYQGAFPSIPAAAEHLRQKYPGLVNAHDVAAWGYTLDGYHREGSVTMLHQRDARRLTEALVGLLLVTLGAK